MKLTVIASLVVTVVSLISVYTHKGGALWLIIGFLALLASSLVLVAAKIFFSSPKENLSFIKFD